MQILHFCINATRSEIMTKEMNTVIKIEEFGQFLASIFLFSYLPYSWWVFPAAILIPDLSMGGYLFNTKIGALLYNIFHHKLLGIIFSVLGFWQGIDFITLAGLILFGHSAMDRMFGYGLKFPDDFKHTHLGWIGR